MYMYITVIYCYSIPAFASQCAPPFVLMTGKATWRKQIKVNLYCTHCPFHVLGIIMLLFMMIKISFIVEK